MIELEKKLLLREDAYLYLKEHRYVGAKSAEQKNYYYDTESFSLCRKGITCRIREKEGVFTATVKEHSQTQRERSLERSRRLRSRWDDSVFRERGLQYQGCLTTLRTVFVPCCDVAVMLDRNSYLDTTDYELEIEYMPQAEARALEELNAIACDLFLHGVLPEPAGQACNKAERFFRRKASINGIWEGED